MTTRRDFLQMAAAGGVAGVGLGRTSHWIDGSAAADVPQARRALRILILGGTGFIGPHMVRSALARGHTVTIFNRGRSNTHLFPNVERLVGDRNGDLESLEGHTWDAVIDNSATNPKWVRDTTQLLKDATDVYLFTSTRSVFRDFTEIGMDVDGPLYEPDPGAIDRGETLPYGPSKVLCERETRLAFGDRALIVRPGLIVGPGDNTDRFTYWPARIHAGGEVLAPGNPDNPVMFIDVRDLAEWYVHLLEQETRGIFMALGPEAPLSFSEMLYGIRAVTNTPMSFTWVDTDFLLDRDVSPYANMPLWMPARGNRAGFQRFDITRSLDAGLKYRPLAVTAKDTLDFHLSRPADRQAAMRAGIERTREAELLAAWHGR